MSGRVAWISISPVKGLALHQLETCELTEAGVTGDRLFFLVDENSRLVNSKGLGALQQIVPRHDDEQGLLELAFPDGTTVAEQVRTDGALDAQFWGATVPVRVVDGPWSKAISDFAGKSLRLVQSPGRRPTACVAALPRCSAPAPYARWPACSASTRSTGAGFG